MPPTLLLYTKCAGLAFHWAHTVVVPGSSVCLSPGLRLGSPRLLVLQPVNV